MRPRGLSPHPEGCKKLSRAHTYGCMLARIGYAGKPRAIKRKAAFEATCPGQLHLLLNVTTDAGTRGEFLVNIRAKE